MVRRRWYSLLLLLVLWRCCAVHMCRVCVWCVRGEKKKRRIAQYAA